MTARPALAAVVMGVSGCGKTVVGGLLAQRLGATFIDADDLHPPANVEKMRAGIPLDDADRAPWLALLNARLREEGAAGRPVVLACSALKQRYRDALADGVPGLRFVHLAGGRDVIAARLAARQHRYMPASLLDSQFAALEPPAGAIAVDVALPVEQAVEAAARALGG
jgi:carbohydrate kinase (thermoresistant glucokinase family)